MEGLKKDAGGAGYRIGGNGDPGRGVLIRTDISISNILALVGAVAFLYQFIGSTSADVENNSERLTKIEGNRFTSRDGEWLQKNLAAELRALRFEVVEGKRRAEFKGGE